MAISNLEAKRRLSKHAQYTELTDIEGQHQIALYVYEAPLRLWHWVNALCIVILAVSGYFIGSPLPAIGGEASEHFLFGYIRFAHFAAGLTMCAAYVGRCYWALVGNFHARQIYMIPVFSSRWWYEVIFELKWYLFLEKTPKRYLGHNPLAQLAMFTLFHIPLMILIFTGLGLYSEGLGHASLLYRIFGFVFLVPGGSMMVHTIHHLGMWLIVIFSIVHIYAAVREEIMSRQSIISTMVSGWRMFRD